jgi:hypothetical protein
MTPKFLAGAIICVLARIDLEHAVAVVVGDENIQHAHAAFLAGQLGGYVSITDSPVGLIVSTQTCDGDIDAQVNDAIDVLVSRLGARDLKGARA